MLQQQLQNAQLSDAQKKENFCLNGSVSVSSQLNGIGSTTRSTPQLNSTSAEKFCNDKLIKKINQSEQFDQNSLTTTTSITSLSPVKNSQVIRHSYEQLQQTIEKSRLEAEEDAKLAQQEEEQLKKAMELSLQDK